MIEAISLKDLPQELKFNALWCCWKYVEDKGRMVKKPFNVLTGQGAKSNDSSTFVGYPVLLQHIGEYLNIDGNGKQLGGVGLGIFRGYSAVDIDHCVDENGKISDMAQDIINYCQSYTEYSPSKTGIRIIFKTQTQINKTEYYINNSKLGLEIYISDNTNKFVTITGNKISGDTINEIDMLPLLNKYMKKNKSGFNLEKTLERDAKLKELWNKKAPGSHADESETDMALCCKLAYYLKNDEALIKQYFEMSPYYQSKDDEHKRKWNSQYALDTIKGANSYIGQPTVANKSYDLNDTGNAHRFIDMFGDILRYNVDNKMWMIWNGNFWQYDITESVKNYIEILAESMLYESNNINDVQQRIKMIRNIEDIYSSGGKESLLKEARHLPGIPVTNDELDRDKYLICTQSGTINLKDGSIRENLREDLMSQCTNCGISEEEPTLWLKTLNEIFQGNKEVMHYVHKALGYSISDLCVEQIMFILQSDGNSGKSLIFDIIRTILSSYAITSSSQLITEEKYNSGSNKEEIARLKGKRLVVIDEIEQGDKGNERLIKNLTAGLTPLIGKFLYANSFEFTFRGKIWLLTNYDFIIRGTDRGIWRRIVKIPLYSDFTGKEDKYLRDKLMEEGPQILGWLLEGFRLYLEEGLQQPKCIIDATKEYKEDMDLVSQWINEYCECKESYFARANELYDNFKAFCQRRDQRTNQTIFGRNLGKKFRKYNSGEGIVYIGLRLKKETVNLEKRVNYEQIKVSEDI